MKFGVQISSLPHCSYRIIKKIIITRNKKNKFIMRQEPCILRSTHGLILASQHGGPWASQLSVGKLHWPVAVIFNPRSLEITMS